MVAGGREESARRTAEELHSTLRLPDGSDDASKSTKLVDVYALKIHLATVLNDLSEMEVFYERVTALQSAIPDSRTLG